MFHFKVKILIAFILFIFILFVYKNYKNYKHRNALTIFKSTTILPSVYKITKNVGPTFVIISSTHGNELSSGHYFQRLVEDQNYDILANGTYYIIPFVNISAALRYERTGIDEIDINRSWPNKHKINSYLLPIIDQANYILDFHEGWGVHKYQKESVGQSFSFTHDLFKPIVNNMINKLNNKISKDLYWSISSDTSIDGSLRNYALSKNIPYLLTELKGQDNVVKMSERIYQLELLFNELMNCMKI